MKLLILLFLILLVACSHEHDHTHDREHPLIGHTHAHDHPLMSHTHDDYHEHDVPHHDHLNPLGLPFTYITRVDPPIDVPGVPPFGFLKSRNHDYKGLVTINFSGPPWNLTLTNIDYPNEDATPVTGWGVKRGNYLNRATVYTDCGDPEHTGYIAFRLEWDPGFADFYYQCPEEEEE